MNALNDPRYNDCICILQDGLKSSDPLLRMRAVFLAGETGKILVSEELKTVLLNDKKSVGRARAAEAIGKTKDKSALESLKIALAKDKDAFTRACAVEAIGKIGDRALLDFVRPVLNDKDQIVRVAAAEAMIRLGDESALGFLRAALKNKSPQVSRWACDALASLGDLGDLASLQSVAHNDADPLVKIWAARAVLLLQKPKPCSAEQEYLAIISGFLSNKDPGVRSRVVCALGDIASESSLPLLKAVLKDDRDTVVKLWAAQAMGKMGIGALLVLTDVAGKDPQPVVKLWAAEAMGKLGELSLALSIARPFLKDSDPVVRLHAAKSVLILLFPPTFG